MKITCLVENTGHNPALEAEHGLSLWIEVGDKHILFDMGQTDMFFRNAQKLGIDLTSADAAVLSHGHYDHGGGLECFLNSNAHAPVYITPTAFEIHLNAAGKDIGLNPDLQSSRRLIRAAAVQPLWEGATLFSCNDRSRMGEGTSDFSVVKDCQRLPDTFDHEQYLLLEENGKKVLISGCSHKGIENIVSWFCPDVLVGGFHFSRFPLDEKLLRRARVLAEYPTVYYTCHCTGTSQFDYMRPVLPDLRYISTGQTISL